MDSPMFNLTRQSVARVLVERDITQVAEKEVWIGSTQKGYWQKVFIEQHPLYCSNCRIFGHSSDKCYILHPELKIDVRQVGKEVVKPQENVPIEKLKENVLVDEAAMAGEGGSHGEGMSEVEKAGVEDFFVEEGLGVDVGLVPIWWVVVFAILIREELSWKLRMLLWRRNKRYRNPKRRRKVSMS